MFLVFEVLKRDMNKVSYFDRSRNNTAAHNKLRTDYPLASAMLADTSRILEFAENIDPYQEQTR